MTPATPSAVHLSSASREQQGVEKGAASEVRRPDAWQAARHNRLHCIPRSSTLHVVLAEKG